MALPTASKLTTAANCAPSFALPHVNYKSPDSNRGTAGHLFLQLVGGGLASDRALEQVAEEHRESCAQIDLEGLPLGKNSQQEVAFAFDLATGRARVLGAGLGRDYSSAAATEYCGTIDVETLDPAGVGSPVVPEVTDYKFDGFESYSPPVAENHQVQFSALCVSRIYGFSEVKGTLIHFRSDGSHWRETATFDALALDEFELKLRDIAKRVRAAQEEVAAGKVPTVSRGEWCRYCPAFAACPAVTSLVRAVAAEPAALSKEILAALTPETAARAYLRLREVEAVIKEVRSQIYLYASERPIDLGDGYEYGPVKTQTKVFDARKVRPALAKLYGPEVAEEACDFETSARAIERAIRPVYEARVREAREAKERGEKRERVTIKSVTEEAIAAVQAAGAISFKESKRVDEHKKE